MEEIRVQTADRVDLALVRIAARGQRRGVCLCTHAMMADSRYLYRAAGTGGDRALGGLAGHLAGRGVEVFVLDWRGHGKSRPHLSRRWSHWCFDDLVEYDLPAVVAAVCAAADISSAELVYCGHSLGGLVGLAAQVTGAIGPLRAMGLWASSVWLTGRRGPLVRRLVMAGYDAISRPLGRAPIRALGLGSAD
ncbi:MAG: alpha/beta fold hydrolase, partial [Myxococcota bacterium]